MSDEQETPRHQQTQNHQQAQNHQQTPNHQQNHSTPKKPKRRRATCVVVTKATPTREAAVLIGAQWGYKYDMLPGGRVEPGEAPIIAAIRELREETRLRTEGIIKLFEHSSAHHQHHVFLIKAQSGDRYTPRSDLKAIWSLPLSELKRLAEHATHPKLSSSTQQVLTLLSAQLQAQPGLLERFESDIVEEQAPEAIEDSAAGC